ncbi:MAG: FHA domain-containing protein [Gammaproteobacteria bacterium]|nr:FHA domain-containing protein [Gammaproteobacteria bacterium]
MPAPDESQPRERKPRSEVHDHGALEQFESKLAARTKVPSERLPEFFGWEPDKIRREAEIVSRILKRFAEAVVDAIEQPEKADDFLRSLDLKAISRDHDWRSIFSTIRSQETDCGEYQRATLIKYLQYLSFRKRLLDFILMRKQGLEETDGYETQTLYPPAADATQSNLEVLNPEEFVRLSMGENVALDFDEGEKFELKLANHLFRVVGARPPCLVDQNGVMYFLRPGRNMIGRHPESDVPIDPNFGHVSRAHLIIEWDANWKLNLIDLSSRGTFLQRKVMQRESSLTP